MIKHGGSQRRGRGAGWLGLVAWVGLGMAFDPAVSQAFPAWPAPAQESEAARPAPNQTREAWDAVYIAGQKVGHIHTRVEPVQAADGRELVRVRVDSRLRFKRLDDTVVISTRYGTIETPEGAVLRLDARSKVGPTETRVHGDAQNSRMPLTFEGGGQRQTDVIAWDDQVRGPYGPELSLSRDPIAPGETREVKTFIPDLNKVGLTKLRATEEETITLGGGVEMDLLRVESEVFGPNGKPLPGMDTTYWIDTSGQVLKSETDVFGGLVTYRTTEEGALAEGRGDFDLVEASIVRVARPIPNPERTRGAVYRVTVKGDLDPSEIFPADGRQTIRKEADGTILLEVNTQGATPAAAAVSEELAANPMVNSEDARIVTLMNEAIAGTGNDAWSRATAVNRWVAENVREKNFETAFANARDTARQLAGDCSEHSVLTAAMCRAAGIPTRVAVGLVYAEHLQGFGFHMWNEVLVDGRWVAIDPTLNQTEVDATHLKLEVTNFDGISPYEVFLSVVNVFDKLELEPIEVR